MLGSGVSLYEHFCSATARTSPTEEVQQLHTRPCVCQQQRETLGQQLWGKASQSTNPGLTNENLNTVLLIYYFSPSTSSPVKTNFSSSERVLEEDSHARC